MRKLNILIICSLIMFLAACNKEEGTVSLPNGSVSFDFPSAKDSVEISLPIIDNVAMVFDIKASLSGSTSSSDHQISFGVDTTKIADFRTKYGNAVLLPATSYLFYKANTVIRAGSSVSEPAQLNVGQQTKLKGRTTYVLPVVIQSVDGKIEGPATTRVIYYVFKTQKAQFIPRDTWTIAAFSSQNSTAVGAAQVRDENDKTTYWLSSTTQQMPQFVTINFNDDYTFTGVRYFYPTILPYPTSGGHPTSIQIETSMNGTTWINKGIFAGNLVNNEQTLDLGITTARYLRFTVLAAARYSNLPVVFVSGIALVP